MCPFLLSISHPVPFTKRLQPFSLLFRPSNSDYLCSQPLSTPNSKLFPMMRHLHLSSLLGSSSSSFGGSSRSEGESDGEEDMDDERGEVGTDECGAPERWSVLGIGQAMVDFSGIVDDGFLDRLGLEKGTRKVVNHEERGRVLQAMDGCNYKAAAGGSLSNSLVALARLGARPVAGRVLHVAMAGSVGSDPLGGFFWSKLHRANVHFHSAPVKDGTTGTVIVLTTPDAQRTMLSYRVLVLYSIRAMGLSLKYEFLYSEGASSTLTYDPCLASAIAKTDILVVEGYLFELPDTIQTITKACKDARRSGALVAITASDVSCIEKHYDDFWDVITNYADIVFANSDEARALCRHCSGESPESTAKYLSHFATLVSVTDGPRGSYIGARGEAVYIPPPSCVPVDTCGAGDAYASGILYCILHGVSGFKIMGSVAAKVAAVVVGQQGTRLRVQDAAELADCFALHVEASAVGWDGGSDHISSV